MNSKNEKNASFIELAKNRVRGWKQLSYLPPAHRLEAAEGSQLGLLIIALIGALIFLFVVWAALTPMQEMVVSYGEVIPQGKIETIQHLEGGIVSDIYVKEGQEVTLHQPILDMEKTAARSELKQAETQEVNLTLTAMRLNAYLKNQSPKKAVWKKNIKTPIHHHELMTLIQAQENLLAQQYKTVEHQHAVLVTQCAEKKEEIKNLTDQLTTTQKHLQLMLTEQNMYEKLGDKAVLSKRDFLNVQREVNKAQGEVSKTTSQLEKSKQAFSEAEHRLQQLKSSMHEDAQKELQKNNNELAVIKHQIHALQDRMQRTHIQASKHAFIQGLQVLKGSVVQPGGTLLNLVPLDQELVVESKIATTDIGHVQVGDPVNVKIRTYDYSRYGSIQGKITNISASTFNDGKGAPYYKVFIQLSRSYVGNNPQENHLLPGMTVEANINTGSKSLLQYLLRPLQVAFTSSFRER